MEKLQDIEIGNRCNLYSPFLSVATFAGLLYLLSFYLPVVMAIHDVQRLFVSAVLAGALVSLLSVARAAQLTWLSALACAMAAATAWQPSWNGTSLLLTWLGLLAWGMHVYQRSLLRPTAYQQLWMVVAVLMALAYTVRVGAAIAAAVPDHKVLLNEVFLGFGHVRHFAQLMPLILPILALGCLQRTPRSYLPPLFRPLAMFALLSWCVLLWLNGSAGALYGSLIGLGFATAIAGWERSRSLVMTMLLAACAAVLVILLLDRLLPLLGEIAQSARVQDSGRLEVWGATLKALAEQPLLGWGPDRFPVVVDVKPGHPHNAMLAFAMDFGLVALLLLIIVMWRWFSPFRLARRIRAISVADAHWPVALTAAAFGGLAHAQVSGVTVMPLAQLLLALTLGLLLAAVADEAPERSFPRASRLVGGLLAVGLVMATLASAWLSPCGPFASRQAACSMTPSFWASNPITHGRECHHGPSRAVAR